VSIEPRAGGPARPHWRLILNGKSAGDEAARAAVLARREAGVDLEVRVTWEQGDAGRYAREAVEDDASVIIAAGGDGTLHEVCAALADSARGGDELPAVGLMPLGTANDFAAAAGISTDPGEALALVAKRPARPIDLLRVRPSGGGAYWCVNLATGGFATEITTDTPDDLKRVLGAAAYFITGVAKVASMRSASGRLYGDGFSWEGDFLLLGVGNGRQAGGGQALTPDAVLDDGALDLMILSAPHGDLAGVLGTLLLGGKAAVLDSALRARLPWVAIETADALTLNLDGEPIESTAFRIDVVPRRLRMHLPEGCALLTRP
jgi:lipid kinase YegS